PPPGARLTERRPRVVLVPSALRAGLVRPRRPGHPRPDTRQHLGPDLWRVPRLALGRQHRSLLDGPPRALVPAPPRRPGAPPAPPSGDPGGRRRRHPLHPERLRLLLPRQDPRGAAKNPAPQAERVLVPPVRGRGLPARRAHGGRPPAGDR